jgi:ParB-like chromosome segregation protein Spo0J
MQLAESPPPITVSDSTVHHASTARVPIARLRVAWSPRLSAPDQAHISLLAQVAEELPPIVVHRSTMTVVDGVHRLEVFRLQGARVVRVRFFEGSDQEAFVESIRLNSTHGKPLTLQERQQAAVRVLRIHPEWSDRSIAQLCGLSPKTVGARRQRRRGEFVQLPYRVGLDGKTRRVDSQSHKARDCARTITELANDGRPDSSRVGAEGSNGNGHLRQPVLTEYVLAGCWNAESSTSLGKQSLMKDSAWQSTETGRAFARWFDSHQVQGDDWAPYVDQLPLSRLIAVSTAARACADVWQHLADAVERRLRHSGASS